MCEIHGVDFGCLRGGPPKLLTRSYMIFWSLSHIFSSSKFKVDDDAEMMRIRMRMGMMRIGMRMKMMDKPLVAVVCRGSHSLGRRASRRNWTLE